MTCKFVNQQFDLIIGSLAASYVQLGPRNGVIYDLKKGSVRFGFSQDWSGGSVDGWAGYIVQSSHSIIVW